MSEANNVIVGLPYHSFKERIRIVNKFDKEYHIENMVEDNYNGLLYMVKKKINSKVKNIL